MATTDTRWLMITPAAGFTGTGRPAVRVRNGIAYFRGYITGALADTNTDIASMPAVALNKDWCAKTPGVQVYHDTGNLYALCTSPGVQQIALASFSGCLVDDI